MHPTTNSTTMDPPEMLIDGAVRKAKSRLVPMIIIMYLIAYIDRANLGFAALRMNADLNLTPDLFGFAAGIFYVGYVIFEVPSNVLLGRFGCNVWFARIMVTWGLLSMATCLSRGVVSLSIVRFLLGFAEAGLAPGLIYYMTIWFPKRELSKVISYYYLGLPLSSIIAGPLSGLILDHMNGYLGLKSWQWLFILEGIPALIVSVFALLYVTNTPKEAMWLTDEERDAYAKMMAKEHQEVASHGHADLRASLLSPQVWVLGIAYSATVFGLTGLVFWMPQIIKQFHFSDTSVGLLSTIPYIIGAIVMCWWAARSDAKKERFWHFMIPSLIFSLGFVLTAFSSSPWGALIGMIVSTAAFLSAVPVYYTLPASFLVGAASAGGMAVCNAVGNIGGFFGPWILGYVRQRSGASAALYLCALVVLIAPALVAYLRFTNKQMRWK
jgi:ACS family tartrate transporter-like MFS transporter